jgi:hypothetical protein
VNTPEGELVTEAILFCLGAGASLPPEGQQRAPTITPYCDQSQGWATAGFVLVMGEGVVQKADQGIMNHLEPTDGRVRTGRSTSIWYRAGYPGKVNEG